MLETLLAGAVVPAVLDLFKGVGGGLSRKFFGLSVDDQIKLANADVEKLKALAELDNPHGTPSQWVVNLRAAFRYVGALVVIIIGCAVLFSGIEIKNDNVQEMGFTLIGLPFSFIFGERLYLGLKGAGNK